MFRARKPDPRVWLLFTVTSSMLAFMLPKHCLRPIYAVGMLLLAALFGLGERKAAFKGFLPYMAVIAWELIAKRRGVGATFSMIKMIVLLYEPPLLCGLILARAVKLSELLTALANMRLPRKLILPLAVAFRYFPTLKAEAGSIRESLLLRAMKPSPLHPIRSMENYLIPLLMRSLKVSDELSRSALCRGYSLEGPRGALVPVALCPLDYVFAAGIILWDVSLWIWAGGYLA
ncbi:energy-coupling factor transporter transmembrane component T [Pseudoramibacter alactolyticus]|uniref:energy-coupling factor transporter transmembrane component T n=1 Tax=Pseudoramibacter alactolyticus TaxID=113287 RepID=UPI0028D8D845|nr:energy-coupling factor transporter transmembrane component T [Pseudoramibacter alactolyticus]